MPEEANKLFVGNLPYSVDDKKINDLFGAIEGVEVVEAKVITDKFSGRSRGFGFVTCKDAEMAKKAIDEMNNKEIDGRAISVNVARPQSDKPRGRDFNNQG